VNGVPPFIVRLGTACLIFLGSQVAASIVAPPVDASPAKHAPTSQAAADIVELAARYENGEGVDRDYSRALALYCEAADQGDDKAFLSLGWMYLNGRGVAIDDGIAVRWFKKAADRGVPQAVNLLQTLSGVASSPRTGCSLEPAGFTARGIAPPREISAIVARMAKEAGVDPDLVMAIIWTESEFNPRAVSARNAQGLMQLMPETAARFHVTNTFDPTENIRGGTAYLRWLLDRFDGDLKLALGAYNAGENAIETYHGVPGFPETIRYIANVTKLYYATSGSPSALTSATGTARDLGIRRRGKPD
jgi:soluble lytic murein transglycosylase-like protein